MLQCVHNVYGHRKFPKSPSNTPFSPRVLECWKKIPWCFVWRTWEQMTGLNKHIKWYQMSKVFGHFSAFFSLGFSQMSTLCWEIQGYHLSWHHCVGQRIATWMLDIPWVLIQFDIYGNIWGFMVIPEDSNNKGRGGKIINNGYWWDMTSLNIRSGTWWNPTFVLKMVVYLWTTEKKVGCNQGSNSFFLKDERCNFHHLWGNWRSTARPFGIQYHMFR